VAKPGVTVEISEKGILTANRLPGVDLGMVKSLALERIEEMCRPGRTDPPKEGFLFHLQGSWSHSVTTDAHFSVRRNADVLNDKGAVRSGKKQQEE